VDARAKLIEDARTLGVSLEEDAAARLLKLLDELTRWNKTYNLTSITDREAMLTHHLLDSLSVHPHLHGRTVADVGTGPGFPGLPLAAANPDRRFTLIDSNNKKVRFVAHAARALGLTNVAAVHARSEAMRPAESFESVVARAFAPLPQLLEHVAPLCGPQTRVLAMKGKRPEEELAAVPPNWRVLEVLPLQVPGLNEARHLVIAAKSA
jgi:16S rRNA (guanine527-N7)-methyltransferase